MPVSENSRLPVVKEPRRSNAGSGFSVEAAETMALQAAAFLGADDDRLAAFCAETGFAPGEIAASLTNPQFLGGVLDYILQSDDLVLGLASTLNVQPETVAAARRHLPGA